MSATSPDVLMGSSGDLPSFSRHERGANITAQRVRARLLTHRGDWPLDVTAGIDWIGWMSQKPVQAAALAATIAQEVAQTPGVREVQDLDWSQEGQAVTISATVITTDGQRLPLVVDPQGAAGTPSVAVGMSATHSHTVVP